MKKSVENKPSHLRALLKKNWIIWKRGRLLSLLEILIPVAFAAVTIIFRKIDSPTEVPQTSYLYNPYYSYDFTDTVSLASLRYIKNCAAGLNGGKVALAPSGNDIITKLANLFRNIIPI